ncbi:RES domain-containing protein [Mycobacterium haemophilum]
MIATPEEGRILWRVGYYTDPLGFTPIELYQFSHRFDDSRRRFRTLYCADLAETCLREVLADFRPNLDAMRRHVERYGPAVLQLDGPLVDLTDVPTRQQIEHRHVDLLLEHNLQHLDLHEITTSRRDITQTIAADLFDHGAGAVRFPSRLDGHACVALFEGRGTASLAGDPIPLTDPPPEPLTNVITPWGLVLEPAR